MMTAFFLLALTCSVYFVVKSAKDEQRRQAWRQICRVKHHKA